MFRLGRSPDHRQGGAANPGGRHLPYQPALDGIRALAVSAVLAYPRRFRLGRGGFLGVDAFFVLSGYLITSLLLTEWRRSSAASASSPSGRDGRDVSCRRCSSCSSASPSTPSSSPGPRSCDQTPRRCPRHDRLRGQLAADIRRPVLLRPVLPAFASAPYLVAGD